MEQTELASFVRERFAAIDQSINEFTTGQKKSQAEFQEQNRKDLLGINSELAKFKQMGVRLPIAGGGNALSDGGPLIQESKVADFAKAPQGRNLSVTVQTPFKMKMERKAATPTLGVGATIPTGGPWGMPEQPLRLVELLPQVQVTSGAAASYAKETTFTPGAAVVPEGTLKPDTDIQFAEATCGFQVIATISKATLQSLADTPGIQAWIENRLRYAVMLTAEATFMTPLLAAAGTVSAGFTPPATGSTQLDTLAGAIAQLNSLGYIVDGVVLSAQDAWQMQTLKSSAGEYLWSSPDSAVGVQAVWRTPVVISPSMAPGQYLIGAFANSTILFNRQMLTVEIAYENEDDFKHNLACFRAEERAGLAIPVPQGLLKGTFNVVTP